MDKRARNFRLRTIGLISLFLAGLGLAVQASAHPSLAVTLIYFRGTALDNSARLEWETGTESDTAAFEIQRSENAGGPFSTLSEIGLVPATGTVSSGATYQVIDETALNGNVYWYRLVEVLFDNSRNALETIEVQISIDPTSVPVGGDTGNSTSTPIPTSTQPPTATPQPSATASPPVPTPTAGVAGAATQTSTASGPAASATRPRATNTPQATATAFSTDAAGAQSTTSAGSSESSANIADAAGNSTAIAQVTLTPESLSTAYPGPATGGTAPTNAQPTGETYPGGIGDSGATQDSVSGIGSNAAAGDSGAEAESETPANSSSLLLWVGFLVALLIFAGGVFYSIVLFARRQQA